MERNRIAATFFWLQAFTIAEVQPNVSLADPGCSNTLITLVEQYFGVSSLQGVASHLLSDVQGKCTSGDCPSVKVASGCNDQSIDDINCEIELFTDSLPLGTSDICKAGCSDVPCQVACKGIDVGICKGAEYVLCKGGCLGIHSCIQKCEHAIVDPCVKELVKECSDKCEATMSQCMSSCEKELKMQIKVDFEHLQHMVTSMNVSTLDANCQGNGITDVLSFQANGSIRVSNAALSLKAHITDAGISTTNAINLDKVAFTFGVPFSGSVDCGIWTHNITMTIGEPQVTDFDVDVNMELDKTLADIVTAVCADLSFCKDYIKDKITSDIKSEIQKQVPGQVAKNLQPVLQKMVSEAKCPHLAKEQLENAAARASQENTLVV